MRRAYRDRPIHATRVIRAVTLATVIPISMGRGPIAQEAKTREPATIEPADAFRETAATRAIDRGVAWLTASQNEDGSWTSPQYGKNTGLTSLALLALLARGHVPGRGEYGRAIERGVAWVIASEQGGVLHRGSRNDYAVLYSHGIATLLLGQVAGMVDESRPDLTELSRVHRRAVDVILRAQASPKSQRDTGGWRYQIDSRDADISVTGWQLLALRAAEECRLDVPRAAIESAVAYVRRLSVESGAFLYTSDIDDLTLGRTGTGILTLELCGDHGSKEALAGGKWLLERGIAWEDRWFYYGAYYSTHAMYQLGGAYWKAWKPRVERLLLEHQTADGSWELPDATPQEAEAGKVYTTALAILALSVELRYLPIYQR